MSIKKVFITGENSATIICPQCKKSKTINVEKYKNLAKAIKMNIKCACGHKFAILLERRKFYRKDCSLDGFISNSKNARIMVTVRDISKKGIQFDLKQNFVLKEGDQYNIEFNLDDGQKTTIEKEIIIKSMHGQHVGVEFTNVDGISFDDRKIGFYLMP